MGGKKHVIWINPRQEEAYPVMSECTCGQNVVIMLDAEGEAHVCDVDGYIHVCGQGPVGGGCDVTT